MVAKDGLDEYIHDLIDKDGLDEYMLWLLSMDWENALGKLPLGKNPLGSI